jgi:hypothetical protein
MIVETKANESLTERRCEVDFSVRLEQIIKRIFYVDFIFFPPQKKKYFIGKQN